MTKTTAKDLGISIRFIRSWTPEPIEREVARDAAVILMIRRQQRDEFMAMLNRPGAQE